MGKRTQLTEKEIDGFVSWHEQRMKDQSFPDDIKEEFRRNRNKFFKIPQDKQIPKK